MLLIRVYDGADKLVTNDVARSYATIALSRAELGELVRDASAKLAASAGAHAKNLKEREDKRQARLFRDEPTTTNE